MHIRTRGGEVLPSKGVAAEAGPKRGLHQPLTLSEQKKAILLTASFLCVVAVGLWHHELWRDEWQAWLLARDSASVLEMLRQVRFEGHLPAWNLILYVLSRFTRDPLAMQAVHLAFAAASIYLLSRFAPLPWLQKVLLAFGYFLAYEYAVIARPYALGVLALFAFCALFPVRHRHPVAIFLSLVLLAITSIYGVILSMAAGGTLLVERVAGSGARRVGWLRGRRVWLGVAAWLLGLAVAALALRPPGGFSTAVSAGNLSPWSVAVSVSTLNLAYLPLPAMSPELAWGTHFLPRAHTREALGLSLALAMSLGGAALLLFSRKPAALFLYVAGTGGLLAFHQWVFAGYMRHHGQLFLVFVASLWISALPVHEWRLPPWPDRWSGPGRRVGAVFITGILLVHVAAAGLLYRADARNHFSAAPAVAAFIQGAGLGHLPVAASPIPAASSVAGYLDRPIHYLAFGGPGTFVPYGQYPRRRDRNLSADLIRPFVERADSDVLLLLRRPFDDWGPGLDAEELARFPPGLERSEEYVIYRVRSRPAH
jgi:hypothetical protein